MGESGEFSIFAANYQLLLHKTTDFAMRFIGDYTAKADSKGRVFLPAAFRKTMDAEGVERFVLRKDLFQPCLVLYPESVWNAQLDDLKQKLNAYNRSHQMIMRQFVADAELIELDSNGRFLISKRKLEFAKITSDVRFLAVDERIEVWDREELENIIAASDSLGDNLESILGGDEQDGKKLKDER